MINKFDEFINEAEKSNESDVVLLTVCYISDIVNDKNVSGKVLENVRKEIEQSLPIDYSQKWEVKQQKITSTPHCTEIELKFTTPCLFIRHKNAEDYILRDIRSSILNASDKIDSTAIYLQTKTVNVSKQN